MAGKKAPGLTELEQEIMRALWKRGDSTPAELCEELAHAGRALSPSSMRTMLAILGRKECVARRAAGRGFVYRARVSQDQAQRRMLETVLDRFFNGSAMGLVAALLKGSMVSKKDIAGAQRMIRQSERRGTTEKHG